MLQYQKAASRNAEDKKVNYRLLSGFLVTFTTAIAIAGLSDDEKYLDSHNPNSN